MKDMEKILKDKKLKEGEMEITEDKISNGIINGYYEMSIGGVAHYFKYPTAWEAFQIDAKQKKFLKKYKEEGYIPLGELLEDAKKEGLWNDEKDREFEKVKEDYDNIGKDVWKFVLELKIDDVESFISNFDMEIKKYKGEKKKNRERFKKILEERHILENKLLLMQATYEAVIRGSAESLASTRADNMTMADTTFIMDDNGDLVKKYTVKDLEEMDIAEYITFKTFWKTALRGFQKRKHNQGHSS